MGAVLRSDNFVEGAKIVLRAIAESSDSLQFCFRAGLDARPPVSASSGLNHAAGTLLVSRVSTRWAPFDF